MERESKNNARFRGKSIGMSQNCANRAPGITIAGRDDRIIHIDISANNRCRVYPARIITRSVRTTASSIPLRESDSAIALVSRRSVTDRESVFHCCVS